MVRGCSGVVLGVLWTHIGIAPSKWLKIFLPVGFSKISLDFMRGRGYACGKGKGSVAGGPPCLLDVLECLFVHP